MIKDLKIESQVDIYHSPVENILDKLKEKRFDMCLTSPPYYDLEVYSHEETQSIQKFKSYDELKTKFNRAIGLTEDPALQFDASKFETTTKVEDPEQIVTSDNTASEEDDTLAYFQKLAEEQ